MRNKIAKIENKLYKKYLKKYFEEENEKHININKCENEIVYKI